MSERPLWAPWRIEYIVGEKSGGCFLCSAFDAEPENDRENLVLYRGKNVSVIMNRFPYNSGHLMICPHRHICQFEDLTTEEAMEIHKLTALSIRVLKAKMNPQGFNVGYNLGESAGAGLKDHMHQHIVPRWSGDTNFMPVLGDTRCVPQALTETYDFLKDGFDNQIIDI